MPNAWAQNWGSSLTGIGDDIGGFLQKKRQEEEFQEKLKTFLYRQGAVPMSPMPEGQYGGTNYNEQGIASGRGYQPPNQLPQLQVQDVQRENPFDQNNMANLLNFARHPQGRELIQTLLATRGQEKLVGGDPEGLYKVRTDAMGNMGNPQMVQAPIPRHQAGSNLSFTTETLDERGNPMAYSFGRDPVTGKVVTKEPLGKSYQRPPAPVASMQPDKLMIDLTNGFNANEQVKRAQQMASNSSIANDILAGKNPIGDEAIKVFMARASGEVGNLSQSEQERYGGSKAILENVEQIAKTLQTGKLTDANRKYMKDLADAFGRGGKRMLQRMAKDYSSQYSQNPLYGMDSDRMYKYLLPQSAREEEKDIDSVLDEVFGKKK